SFVSPIVFSYLVDNIQQGNTTGFVLSLMADIVPHHLPWVSIYWCSVIISLSMVVIIALIKFPKIALNDAEKYESRAVIISLLKQRKVLFFFFGIFAYVGTEQGLITWISKFLADYHQLNPDTAGAH